MVMSKVEDLLKLNLKTLANIPLRSHTVDDIKEAIRKDNKQRFSLLEENGELLIRANQGHALTIARVTLQTVESESLLKEILSADVVQEMTVCVHGTYKRNLESILESGLKRMKRLHVHFSSDLPTDGEVISETQGGDINNSPTPFNEENVQLSTSSYDDDEDEDDDIYGGCDDHGDDNEEGMNLYISDDKVILTEGLNGVVPVKYFEKIESCPDRRLIPLSNQLKGTYPVVGATMTSVLTNMFLSILSFLAMNQQGTFTGSQALEKLTKPDVCFGRVLVQALEKLTQLDELDVCFGIFIKTKRRSSNISHGRADGVSPMSITWLNMQLILISFMETFSIVRLTKCNDKFRFVNGGENGSVVARLELVCGGC
ncbi:RNA 2'-phosphotransferase isoform 2 [Hibiscus syriacus]|uniref:RNA 2'-phosphotransferase isoform 2 n=1 Tax=Hibiscus syriacus TaxID=106335 RepID=A0A6A2WU54_HIBSY|nr:RNA 2'-phosphotransferase isoform 2 [Hibiscus syriacus]